MPRIAVLAYSGGLDTTYCALWLREQGYSVHAVAVDTGGFSLDDRRTIEARAGAAAVAALTFVDGREELFRDTLRFLIFANALRGEVYPLCVSAERLVQARAVANYAKGVGAAALVHGSTGAGNDQVRFDVAFRVLAPEMEVLAPIRSQALSREEEMAYVAQRGVEIPPRTGMYSVNQGLWGTTIGGGETHASDGVLPELAYVMTSQRADRPTVPEVISIDFERGVPTALDGEALPPVALIERLNARAGRRGIGRGMHVGDTILGIKGRVAFEAPAATVLIAAHRELEKLVLSRQQQFWKRTLGDLYGANVHEARFFDPVMRDLEAFLESSQRKVTGHVTVRLEDRLATVLGATSPRSLMNAQKAKYGEGSKLWTGEEAAAFCKIFGVADKMQGNCK
ncbi:MAG: argininosuccinate synthase [Phycisphaerales bacterium]|nr:argininosuccinate synthase [Phycisphaerales bacterium]